MTKLNNRTDNFKRRLEKLKTGFSKCVIVKRKHSEWWKGDKMKEIPLRDKQIQVAYLTYIYLESQKEKRDNRNRYFHRYRYSQKHC